MFQRPGTGVKHEEYRFMQFNFHLPNIPTIFGSPVLNSWKNEIA
jgi:hypothetical protein